MVNFGYHAFIWLGEPGEKRERERERFQLAFDTFNNMTTEELDNKKLKENEKVAGMGGGDVKRQVHRLDTLPIDEFPLFMHLPQDASENIPLAALQALLYDGTPEEQALNFKNQGNECYQVGPTGLKDALQFYTKRHRCQVHG